MRLLLVLYYAGAWEDCGAPDEDWAVVRYPYAGCCKVVTLEAAREDYGLPLEWRPTRRATMFEAY